MRFSFGRAAFAALCFALCASLANAQGLEKTKITIGVGGKTLFYYLPLTIAEQKGYFKDEGLDVEFQDFPGRRQGAAGADRRQRRCCVRRLRAHDLAAG